MRNTFIAPGTDENDEIIATCGDGLYAKSMGGGSVNPITGEFNFAVSEGYLIRDGKIDRPVRGATLIGRGSGNSQEDRPRRQGYAHVAGNVRRVQRLGADQRRSADDPRDRYHRRRSLK